jgi:hypothetical protein
MMVNPSAAVGFSIHTGWAAMVVLDGPPPRILVRRRLELADDVHDARFVYHLAQEQPADAERILSGAAATALERARARLRDLEQELSGHSLLVALPKAKTALPDMHSILASHLLIHSAEAELYRRAVADAATSLGIRLATVHPGKVPLVGKPGPPWGKDQKGAAALAWAALTAQWRTVSKAKE